MTGILMQLYRPHEILLGELNKKAETKSVLSPETAFMILEA